MRTNSCIHLCAAGLLALGLFGTAGTASAQQTVVVPESEHTVSRGPSAYLFSSGLITTGLSYTPALVVAINSDRSEDKYLYAPFAGPWLDLAARDGGSKVDKTLLVVDGVFQTIGAIQILASFVFTGSTEVAKSDEGSSLASQTVVAPARVGDAYGLVAVGNF
ncbi:MAG TPA: hypothetical protein VFS67_20495 [Polyangiaceae bacterium]|jgi:hypothetical protein|nr:hypothetical protein [Polyangiaceae bacterium]